jgi:hypothetical protein
MFVRSVVKLLRALAWLSVCGASGELPVGWLNVWTVSWRPAITMPVDKASRMVTLVGNQETVSQMRSPRVSHNQT